MSLTASYLERAATEALGRGDSGKAERLCREALAKNPQDYRCMVMLAHLLRLRDEYVEASTIAEQAIRIRPGMVEAQYQYALNMIAMGRAEEAERALRRAIELRPEVAEFHLNLGLALEMVGRYAEARQSFQRALRLDPNDLQARLSLVNRLLRHEELVPARAHAETALRLAPNSVAANLTLADVLIADGDKQAADSLIDRALSLDPSSAAAHASRGLRQSQLGRFDEAEQSFLRSIELDPRQGQAYSGLAQTKKFTEADRGLVEQMEAVRREGFLSPGEASSLDFALGKAYENLGEYEKSMERYDEAHRAAYTYRFGNRPYQPEDNASRHDAVRRIYTRAGAVARIDSAVTSDVPIIIVGSIRSGTTLTEQILSRHPEVGAAGEHKFWRNHAGTSDVLAELAADPDRACRLASEYVEALRLAAPGTARVTDKLPGNYLRIGLLHQVLPNAKIIHCRRNAIDTVLSIYFTPNASAPAYTLTKEGIVSAYRHYLELMQFWREILPPSSFLEVQYEELVSDPEPVVRRVLEYCELEWNEACLSPELNVKEVSTPSLWQVRQPIYKSSVERWRRYEPWLGAFRELLDVS